MLIFTAEMAVESLFRYLAVGKVELPILDQISFLLKQWSLERLFTPKNSTNRRLSNFGYRLVRALVFIWVLINKKKFR